MRTITLRLCRLELRRREGTLEVASAGDARRLMEEQLAAMSRRMQVVRDRDEFVESAHTFEEVRGMIHAHLEESGIRREENKIRAAESHWRHRHPASRLST
jgi:hypothetical protein